MVRHAIAPHVLGMKLPVFYSPNMVATPDSYSPSAAKPARVVAHWQSLGLPIELHEPTPVTEVDFFRAHDRTYVRDVLSCRESNGFGDRSAGVARSLPWTSGAMLSAARHVLRNGGVACAPCSGFHHAGYAYGGGFCTFNGLMVTACALLAVDRVKSVGILDCDMHYGDGTDDILRRLDLRARVRHFTAGAEYRRRDQAEGFLALLPDLVRSMRECSVILYQAGADPHVNDPLGGWLDDAQLQRRDELVFRAARDLNVPIVWNLAGGYQRDEHGGIAPVLAIHAATARAAIATSGIDR